MVLAQLGAGAHHVLPGQGLEAAGDGGIHAGGELAEGGERSKSPAAGIGGGAVEQGEQAVQAGVVGQRAEKGLRLVEAVCELLQRRRVDVEKTVLAAEVGVGLGER